MWRDLGYALAISGLLVGVVAALAGTTAGIAAGAMLAALGGVSLIEHVRRTTGVGRERGRARFVKRVADLEIEGLICDVDGTLTDGRMHRWSLEGVGRSFHAHDGLGHVLLRERGVRVGWLSGTGDGASIEGRAGMLGVEHVDWGKEDKGDRFVALCKRMGVAPSRTVYMGDDRNDLPAMDRAGLVACPADAVPAVRERAELIVGQDGGHGAMRSVADAILEGLDQRGS